MKGGSSIAALAGLSLGAALPAGLMENWGPYHQPRTDLFYVHAPKPLGKRQRRRLRGKRKEQP